ncbi:helix-turn-helix domain-containing protein [Cupriavidus sp. 8B]
MPIDQAARHCGVSVGMLSKPENGKGVNLEHVLRVLGGLGLTMLVVSKAHAAWCGSCGPDRRGCGQGTACLAETVETRSVMV